MIDSIIFFVSSPFSRRDYERFGIEILKKNGFRVGVVDCTPIVNNDFHEQYGKELSCQFESNEIVDTFKSACEKIKKMESGRTVIVDLLGNNDLAIKLRFEIKCSDLLSMQLYLGLLPTLPFPTWDFKRVFMKIKRPLIFVKRIISKINEVFLDNKKYDLQSYPDFIVGSGEECLKTRVSNKTKIIWTHAMDYDLYLLAQNDEPASQEHVVFLDEDMLFHSDYDYLNILPPVTVEKYYSSLNDFFENIEKITGKPVVIAAHPRSNYETRPDYYRGRKIIKGKTAELIRDASLVLFHATTSINFAILWGKPAMSLTTNELKNSWFQPRIECLANAIGANLVNVDDIEPSKSGVNDWLKVDDMKYQEYRRKYIKKDGTPDIPVWQIVSEYLNSFQEISGVANV